MTTLKVCFLGLSFVVLISCSKETKNPLQNQTLSAGSDTDSKAVKNTQFGVLVAQSSVSETQAQMNRAGIQLVRAQLIFSEATSSKIIDQHLKKGFHVIVNFNWKQTSATVPFPTDAKFIQQQAEAFFKYYAPYRSQIPVVVVENEWDNMGYHSGDIQHYLRELAIVTKVAHKYGFKTSGAGITSKGINFWMASKTSGDTALMWKKMAGSTGNMATYVKRVNAYIDGIKSVDADYINVHWYNEANCSNKFKEAAHAYMQACGKTGVICNEFGIKTNSAELFRQTVKEIKGTVDFAVAYSGVNGDGKAIKLTDEMLSTLNK